MGTHLLASVLITIAVAGVDWLIGRAWKREQDT